MRERRPVVLEEQCIDCGECVRVCRNKAIRAKTPPAVDLTRFDYVLAVPSAPMLVQFQPDVGPLDVEEALLRIGFDEVVSQDQAALAYLYGLARRILSSSGSGAGPLISSHCPAMTRLISTFYPDLLGSMVSMLPPRELAVAWAKARVWRETGIPMARIGAVYLTPCPSKVVDIAAHGGRGSVDAALAISEIYHDAKPAISQMRRKGELSGGGRSSAVLAWGMLGGMSYNLRRMVQALAKKIGPGAVRRADAADFLPVAQIGPVRRVLDDMERGRLGKVDLVEVMACPEGCVGGPLGVDNPYVARSKTQSCIRKLPSPEVDCDWDALDELFRSGSLDMTDRLVPTPLSPLGDDLAGSLRKMVEKEELTKVLPGINCGACGSPTCSHFAEDVVRGMVTVDACAVPGSDSREEEGRARMRGRR